MAMFLEKRRKSAGRTDTDLPKTPYTEPTKVASRKVTSLVAKQGSQNPLKKCSFGDYAIKATRRVSQDNKLCNPYYKDYEDHVEKARHANDNLLYKARRSSQVTPYPRSTIEINGLQEYLGSGLARTNFSIGDLSIVNIQNNFGQESIYMSHKDKHPRASPRANLSLNLRGIQEEDEQGRITPMSRESWVPPVSKDTRAWLHPDVENIETRQIRMDPMKYTQKTGPDDIKPALKKIKVASQKSNVSKSMRFTEN